MVMSYWLLLVGLFVLLPRATHSIGRAGDKKGGLVASISQL
jgi:hypothetical protein